MKNVNDLTRLVKDDSQHRNWRVWIFLIEGHIEYTLIRLTEEIDAKMMVRKLLKYSRTMLVYDQMKGIRWRKWKNVYLWNAKICLLKQLKRNRPRNVWRTWETLSSGPGQCKVFFSKKNWRREKDNQDFFNNRSWTISKTIC